MRTFKNRNPASTQGSIKNCQAVILAGGRGTRLRSVFASGPKSMAPVGERPFLEYLLTWLRSIGIQDLILCVGYKRDQIQNWLGNGSARSLRVQYSEEKNLLGTAGALKQAEKLVSLPLCLVVNGDSFLDVDLRAMCRFHLRHRATATIALARIRNSARYGTVQLDASKRIVAFREKEENLPVKIEPASPRHFQLINGGVYLLDRQFFGAIPSRGAVSLEKDIFPAMAGKGLYGFATPGYFIDIGVPSDFARAQTELPKRFPA